MVWGHGSDADSMGVKPGHTGRILLEPGGEQRVVTEVPLMAQKSLPADAEHLS